MHRLGRILGLLSLGMLLFACQGRKEKRAVETEAWKGVDLSPMGERINERNTAFAFRLFRLLAEGESSGGSFLISPFSVTSLLSMLMNGADGDCLGEMRRALCLDSFPLDSINDYYHRMVGMSHKDSLSELEIGYSVWVNADFAVKSSFRNLCYAKYDAEVFGLDFFASDAVEKVNRWCAEKTGGRIPEVVGDLSERERMLLVNTLYFQGKWEYEFSKEATRPELFAAMDGTAGEVKMMRQTETFWLMRDSLFDIAELPYKEGRFSMVIFLPLARKDWRTCLDAFTAENWRCWEAMGKLRRLDLWLPEFQMEKRHSLKDALRALGMARPFEEETDNFPRLADGELGIGEVLQNTFIAVDEGGTEAAAATVVTVIAEEELPPELQPYPFHVNRPFLFLIKENKSGTILFMGQVTRI